MRRPLSQKRRHTSLHISVSFAIVLVCVFAASFSFLFFTPEDSFAASYTNVRDKVTRLQISITDVVHQVSFENPTPLPGGSTFTITFPVGFTVTAAPTSGVGLGVGPTFNFTPSTMTATCGVDGCSAGLIQILNGEATNPGTPSTYSISISNDANNDIGSTALPIVVADSVTVNAAVEQELSFNAGSEAATAICDSTFAGVGGTVALGALSAGLVTSSDQTGINHICTRVSTNAAGGASVSIFDASSGLASSSTPLDVIDSVSTGSVTAFSAGTEGIGICADSVSGSGTSLGSVPVVASPYNGSPCTSSDHNIGGFDTTVRTLWSVAGPSDRAHVEFLLKASIDGATPAHSDYEDTITIVATGNF